MFIMSFCDAMEQWAKICNKSPNCTACILEENCDLKNLPYQWNPKKIAQLSDLLEKECKNAERN